MVTSGTGKPGASGVAGKAVIAPAVFEMLVADVLVAETLDAVDGVDDQRLESVVLALQVADGFQNLLPVLGRLGEVGDGVGKSATGHERNQSVFASGHEEDGAGWHGGERGLAAALGAEQDHAARLPAGGLIDVIEEFAARGLCLLRALSSCTWLRWRLLGNGRGFGDGCHGVLLCLR